MFYDKDVAIAIKNLGGDESFYLTHLNKFKNNYCDSFEELIRLIHKGEVEDAAVLAHSVKGLAGTFGLTELMRCAESIQFALQDGNTDIEDLLNKYKTALYIALEL